MAEGRKKTAAWREKAEWQKKGLKPLSGKWWEKTKTIERKKTAEPWKKKKNAEWRKAACGGARDNVDYGEERAPSKETKVRGSPKRRIKGEEEETK